MPETSSFSADLALIRDLAQEAGALALRYFGKDPQVWMKEGQSPVTEADYAVDTFLKEKLLAARPDYGWLSEETADDKSRIARDRTFVVDPIDGTRGFIQGSKQWCVSIAIIENNRPIVGVLECPALQETFDASLGAGGRCNGQGIQAERMTKDRPISVAASRKLGSDLDTQLDKTFQVSPFIPSLAYRIAMVADGRLHMALARPSAKDWDLAAADIIVREAGGMLSDISGDTLLYNCADVRHGTLVAGHKGQEQETLDLARRAMNNPNG